MLLRRIKNANKNIIKRCSLSEISDYILGNGEIISENKETDLESEMREIENDTTKILNKYFPDKKMQDKFFGEIAYRETRLESIYFQLGIIAGIKIIKDFYKKL